MKKVMFVCCAGMSTSLLVEKVNKAARDRQIEVTVCAAAEADARKSFNEADILLLGPQVRYLQNSFEKALRGTDTKLGVVDMLAYGRLDGNKVLDQIIEMSNEK